MSGLARDEATYLWGTELPAGGGTDYYDIHLVNFTSLSLCLEAIYV